MEEGEAEALMKQQVVVQVMLLAVTVRPELIPVLVFFTVD